MSVKWFHRLLIAPLPYVPRSIVWQLSRRYIAGTDLASAYATVAALRSAGCTATLDVLGEDCSESSEVMATRDIYLEALRGIAERDVDCYISIKLSDFALRFDETLCLESTETLLNAAKENNNFVRIDMEDSSVTTATLKIYRRLRQKHDNVGTVIQAYLKRSEQDVRELLDEGPTNVRLCKGIYVEPEDIAWTDPDDIRSSYCRLLEQMLEHDIDKVAIATHDPALVQHAETLIAERNLDPSRYEFQMLLGVAEQLRGELVARGHPLRVYVPFGERWFAYSLRRLRENPEIAGHIFSNLFSRK